jgi:nitroreductase
VEEGICGQTILLAAAEQGIGGCFFGSIIRKELAKVIEIPEGYEVKYILALGYPTEEVVID